MNILSIQSHVAYGHVGNAAAVFPLQRLGFEVWPIHTVQFSNHLGYESWHGQVLPADHVADVVRGIEDRGALQDCDAVLSGYLGDADLAEVVLDTVKRVRAANPKALYACDPVIGDVEEGIYVRPGIPEFFRTQAIPAADLITPNQFELQLLTGEEIRCLADALAAARAALALGPRIVMVTSLKLEETQDTEIEVMAVTRDGAWRVASPFLALDPIPKGCGDVITALFLAQILNGAEVPQALERAVASTFELISETARVGTRELQLVGAQESYVAPHVRFPALPVSRSGSATPRGTSSDC